MGTAATVSPPPLGLGRALVLIAASLLLHAFVLSGLRAQLIAPSADAEPAPRTIEAALIVQAPPAPPAPAPRRPAPRRVPRPAPPPPVPAPEPALPEPAAVVDPAMVEPARAAPGESDAPIVAAEVAAPVTPEVDLALVEPKPAEVNAPARGSDLASELSELGGAIESLPTAGTYVYKTRDSRYAALSGTTTIEWQVDAPSQRYESRLRSTVFGIALANISSAGTIRRFGLAPDRYVQKTGTRAPQAANLDWERHVVTFSSRSFQRPAREGMQDRLSFQFQLMALGQRLPNAFLPGATVSMDVAGTGDIETYHFLVIGTEIVETDAGPIKAIKLDRPKGDGADTRIEVWLAPSRRYLPVRLRFTDRRDNVTENLLESANESG